MNVFSEAAFEGALPAHRAFLRGGTVKHRGF